MIRRYTLATATILSVFAGANARAADPLPVESHKVLPAALAVEAAVAAIAACKAQGYNETVTIVDRTGVTKLLLVGDGANSVSTEITGRKAYTSAIWKMSTGDFTKRFSTPGGFNPMVYDSRLSMGQGGLPIKVGDDTIGGIAASGAPGGDKDEACAAAGLAKISDQLN